MNRIAVDNLSQFLSNAENDTVEFKRSIPPHLDVIDRLISAVVNTKGSSIIFGLL